MSKHEFAKLNRLECSSCYSDISTKQLALCVIGQNYRAKCQIVNDLFALKNKNVIGRSPALSRQNSEIAETVPGIELQRSKSVSAAQGNGTKSAL